MSMNIGNQNTQNTIAIDKNKVQKQADTKAENTSSPVSKHQDSVQLTAQAQSLHGTNSTQNKNTEVNSERIEALKTAIINGDYKINVERLAEKISQFEGDFSKYHPT